MSLVFPEDADGDALRRIASGGSDMSRPMAIDFMVAVPGAASGVQVAAAARNLGYQTSVEQDEGSGDWTCYCTRVMVPTHNEVVAAQAELDALARPFGGSADGWGTFGNVEAG